MLWTSLVLGRSMLLVLGFAIAGLGQAEACQSLVPSELLNSCVFDAMTIVVPSTSFSVSRESCNAVIDKSIFLEQPYVYFTHANEDKTYIVIMIDPEDRDRPDEFFVHWIVANIPGYVLKQGLGYDVGDTILDYQGPAPAAFSGPHYYMFLAYEQLATLQDISVPANRAKFTLNEWLETLGGEDVIRGPAASIGFISEY